MKTKIFKTYEIFLKRKDKTVNGVSADFAEQHPDFAEERNNKGCWNCSGCFNCFDCLHCSRCSNCYDCSNIALFDEKENPSPETPKDSDKKAGFLDVPVIKNIHKKILEATSQTGALNMSAWHTCKTTHCRAGWVVHLAGEKGRKLEKKTSTLFAAMQIYKKSSDIRVYPPRFFESNVIAMEDIKRCAEEEKAK